MLIVHSLVVNVCTYNKEGKNIVELILQKDVMLSIEMRSMFNNIHATILERSIAESMSVNLKR